MKKALIAPGVYELRLTKPDGFRFRAGQFVLFSVPLLDDPADVQARAYSIASSPEENDLCFAIKLVPEGRASRWVEHTVEAGTTISFQGPFGAFTLDEETFKRYLFVATGTGIAPCRSQIVYALEQERNMRKMDLLFGVRTAADLFWGEELKALERISPKFRAHVSFLSCDADGYGGCGRIHDLLDAFVAHADDVSVYICGAPETVNELRGICLRSGVPKGDLHTEKYV